MRAFSLSSPPFCGFSCFWWLLLCGPRLALPSGVLAALPGRLPMVAAVAAEVVSHGFCHADELRRQGGLRSRRCRTARPGGSGIHPIAERLAARDAGATVDGGSEEAADQDRGRRVAPCRRGLGCLMSLARRTLDETSISRHIACAQPKSMSTLPICFRNAGQAALRNFLKILNGSDHKPLEWWCLGS